MQDGLFGEECSKFPGGFGRLPVSQLWPSCPVKKLADNYLAEEIRMVYRDQKGPKKLPEPGIEPGTSSLNYFFFY